MKLVIASAAKQSIKPNAARWIASSQVLLATTAWRSDRHEQQNSQEDTP
jgi:hypothetical protein